MAEIYPQEESRMALEVFQVYEGSGEYFDLSVKPIFREQFLLGEGNCMFLKRIHKVLRSRYFLGILGIVLELVQLLAVFTLLYEYFLPITVLGIMFHIGILLYVINKDEIPEFKIPWLIILFILSVIGAFIYMLFTSTGQRRKEYRKFEDAHRRLLPYPEQSETERERLKTVDADAWSFCRNNIIKKWKRKESTVFRQTSSSPSFHASITTVTIGRLR